ncbi:hypothetical protein GEMRC1_008173 [Eukaryota sp. GEM-RC1]
MQSLLNAIDSGSVDDSKTLDNLLSQIDSASYDNVRTKLIDLSAQLKDQTGNVLNKDYPTLLKLLEHLSTLLPTLHSTQSTLQETSDKLDSAVAITSDLLTSAEAKHLELQVLTPPSKDHGIVFYKKFFNPSSSISSLSDPTFSTEVIPIFHCKLTSYDQKSLQALFLLAFRSGDQKLIQQFQRLFENHVFKSFFVQKSHNSTEFVQAVKEVISDQVIFKFLTDRAPSYFFLIIEQILKDFVDRLYSQLFKILAMNSFIEFHSQTNIIFENLKYFGIPSPHLPSLKTSIVEHLISKVFSTFDSESLSYVLTMSFSFDFSFDLSDDESLFKTCFGQNLFQHLNKLSMFYESLYFNSLTSEKVQFLRKDLNLHFQNISQKFNKASSMSTNTHNFIEVFISLMDDLFKIPNQFPNSCIQTFVSEFLISLQSTTTNRISDHLAKNLLERLRSLKVVFASARVQARPFSGDPSQFILNFVSDLEKFNDNINSLLESFSHELICHLKSCTIQHVLQRFYTELQTGLTKARDTEASLRNILKDKSSGSPKFHSALQKLDQILAADVQFFLKKVNDIQLFDYCENPSELTLIASSFTHLLQEYS